MKTKSRLFVSSLVPLRSLLVAAAMASSALVVLSSGQAQAGFWGHALNPQPLPPGRALNPQPLPPGLYSPYHSGPSGGQAKMFYARPAARR